MWIFALTAFKNSFIEKNQFLSTYSVFKLLARMGTLVPVGSCSQLRLILFYWLNWCPYGCDLSDTRFLCRSFLYIGIITPFLRTRWDHTPPYEGMTWRGHIPEEIRCWHVVGYCKWCLPRETSLVSCIQ
jgi:hypothetical protein